MRKAFIVVFTLLFLALSCLWMAAKPVHHSNLEDNRYAVIVGVGQDVNQNNCARLMGNILKEEGWNGKNIIVLTSNQATKTRVLDKIEELKNKEKADSTVVVAFFCHGSSMAVALANHTPFTHKEIKHYLSDLESEKQLVIISSCYSGGAVVPGYDGITLEAPNRIVVTSCSEGTVDTCTHHYTGWAERFLLQGIKEGLADADGNGKVSIEEAHDYGGGHIADNYEGQFFLRS